MKKRISIIVGNYYPILGGVANSTKNFAECLAKKYDVAIITYRQSFKLKKYEKINGVTVYRIFIPLKFLRRFLNLNEYYIIKIQAIVTLLFFIFNKMKSDYIIGQMVYRFGYISSIIKKYLKIKNVCYAHGEDVNQLAGIEFKEKLTMEALKISNGVFVTNKEFLEILSKYVNGEEKKNFYILPNTLKDPAKEIKFINIKKRFNNGNLNLLAIGRFDLSIYGEEIKGFSLLFDLAREISTININIIGDGELKDSYLALINKYNIHTRVKLLGQQDRKSIYFELNRSSAVILPSNIEGLSMVMVEAMAFGLPVIATKIGGAKDYIINKKNGLLIRKNNLDDLVDSVLFLKNFENYYKVSKESRITYKNFFTCNYILKQISNFLKQL